MIGLNITGKALSTSLLLGAFAVGTQTAQASAASPQLSISQITARGPGCPDGSVSSAVSEDGQAFSVFFDQFLVSTDGNARRGTQVDRRNCELGIDIKAPSGWSYALMAMDFRGFANIPRHGVGEVHVSFKNQHHGWRWLRPLRIRGQVADEYIFSRTAPVDTLVWSGCEAATRRLRLNTTLTLVTPHRTDGLLTVNSVDGELSQKFQVQWRRCR